MCQQQQLHQTAGTYKSRDLDMLIPVQTCGAKPYRLIRHGGRGGMGKTGNWEVGGSGDVTTWQVAAQDLHPHADTSRRPPLGENSDVLRHDLVKASNLWRVVVAVPFKNLSGGRSQDRPVTM